MWFASQFRKQNGIGSAILDIDHGSVRSESAGAGRSTGASNYTLRDQTTLKDARVVVLYKPFDQIAAVSGRPVLCPRVVGNGTEGTIRRCRVGKDFRPR